MLSVLHVDDHSSGLVFSEHDLTPHTTAQHAAWPRSSQLTACFRMNFRVFGNPSSRCSPEAWQSPPLHGPRWSGRVETTRHSYKTASQSKGNRLQLSTQAARTHQPLHAAQDKSDGAGTATPQQPGSPARDGLPSGFTRNSPNRQSDVRQSPAMSSTQKRVPGKTGSAPTSPAPAASPAATESASTALKPEATTPPPHSTPATSPTAHLDSAAAAPAPATTASLTDKSKLRQRDPKAIKTALTRLLTNTTSSKQIPPEGTPCAGAARGPRASSATEPNRAASQPKPATSRAMGARPSSDADGSAAGRSRSSSASDSIGAGSHRDTTRTPPQRQMPHTRPPRSLSPRPPSVHGRDPRGAVQGGRQKAETAGPQVALPRGPAWSMISRHLRQPPGDPALPQLEAIILVEGHTDCTAVQRAVSAAVYPVGGSGVMTKQASEQLKLVGSLGRELIVLTDPDREGNALRDHLDSVLGSSVRHAFIPPDLATSTVGDGRHEAGNVGVEHASPLAIKAAIESARLSYGSGRKEFSAEQLMELGLVNSFDSKEVVGARLLRGLLCSALGVGLAGGSALTKLLNRYFTRDQFETALQEAKRQLQERQPA